MFFDTSNFPSSHECYSLVSKRVLGKFKDECKGIPIQEFIGLRPKLYSFKTNTSEIKKKAKGVKKNVTKNEISFEDFQKFLSHSPKPKEHYRLMSLFRSKKHEVSTVTMNKR